MFNHLQNSFQHAGLNRCGEYMKTAREKGPRTDGTNDGVNGRRDEKPNEPWRRIRGIFPNVSLSNDERAAGLERLAEWIKERAFSPEWTEAGGTPAPHNVSFADEWDFATKDWACAKGTPIELLCMQLGLSRAALTVLMKEHCGLSVGEFIDGLKIKSLKDALVLRMREAAEQLWGFPGSYVWTKLNAEGQGGASCSLRSSSPRSALGGPPSQRSEKRSRYFRARPEDFYNESRSEERVRRTAELCDRLRGRTASQRQAGHGTHSTFDLESWAMSAGFASVARLKRACLNVFGKSLSEIESLLAAEVLQFYLCAEDKELRDIASRENEIQIVFRARELYHKSEHAPKPPFLDEWSKFEELKPEWLSRMRVLLVT
jgi:hypothetical protein